MPLKSKTKKFVKGVTSNVSSVKTNKKTGQVRTNQEEERGKNKTFDEQPAIIDAETGVTMNIKFQSVVTRCRVSLPVENTPEGIREGFDEAWDYVDKQLQARVEADKELLDVLVEEKERRE